MTDSTLDSDPSAEKMIDSTQTTREEPIIVENDAEASSESLVSRTAEEELGYVCERASSTLSFDEKHDTPNFLLLSHENDILFDTKAQPPIVKGGTLPALVKQLTRPDKLDSIFNITFLLTYRCFITARELFELLAKRFHIEPPKGFAESDYEMWREKQQQPIRFRVLNVLESWLDSFWMEDQSEATMKLIRDIYTFANDLRITGTPGCSALTAVLEQRLRGQEATVERFGSTPNQAAPTPIIRKNIKEIKFLDINAIEYARQLTIIESALYGKIKPIECLNKAWQKMAEEGQPDPAPNIKALVLHSNQLVNWVAGLILTQRDLKKRVAVIKHFVSVANTCRKLNNYSTLTSIISALGTASIFSLNHTWDQVPAKTITLLKQMRRLMGSNKGFYEYRQSVRLADLPCIPHLAFSLTDLTFIEDGIPSIIKKSGLINFAKYTKIAEVIRDIQRYQNEPYSLRPVPQIQQYILTNMQAASEVHKMESKSLAIEPQSFKESGCRWICQEWLKVFRSAKEKQKSHLH